MITRSLLTRDPFADLERMVDQMDRAFDTFWRPMTNGGTVPVDIYEKEGSLFVCAAVPGVSPEDLEVSLEENVLTIKGETKQNWETTENTKVYRREQRYGSFTRSIRLPDNVMLDQTEAEFNNGFVTIRIPKVQEQRPEAKRIPVRTAGGPQMLENGPRELTSSAERNGSERKHREKVSA
jgi:HSP20 family protein